MVSTRGHLKEYGKDLMNAAKISGAHIVIMTDYDATGVKIASESPTDMPWIGANDSMLKYFNIDRENVKIDSETSANKDYIRFLVKKGLHKDGRRDQRFKEVDIDFLDKYRVELDAILARVGDEKFFEYITDLLQKLFPNRDYNRAIEISLDNIHARHEDSIMTINKRVARILSPESEKIRNELSSVAGFVDVKEKNEEIQERLRRKLSKNPDYIDFGSKIA